MADNSVKWSTVKIFWSEAVQCSMFYIFYNIYCWLIAIEENILKKYYYVVQVPSTDEPNFKQFLHEILSIYSPV